MSLLQNTMAKSGTSDFYNGQATQSLRFEDGSSTYLTKTFSSDGTGSGATCTVSCWVKRNNISNNDQWFFTAGASSPAWLFGFRTADTLAFGDDDGNPFVTVTDRVFRDTSAWYHLVLVVKTSESSNADKYKIYVNGELQATTFSGTAADTLFGANVVHNIGRYPTGSTYVDLYMSDLNFVDGLALDPTYFAESKNGVWIPKEPVVSEYGTNGFRFKFDQVGVGTASTSTIGADTSGNTNHFTSSGIVASDCAMPDSPENNFATGLGGLSESRNDQGYVSAIWSEGNLRMTPSAGDWSNGMSNFGMTSGKWYAEAKVVNIGPSGTYTRFGMRASPIRTYDEYFWLAGGNGQIDAATSPYSARVGTYANGNVLQIALDLENNALYFGKNGTWENSATTSEIAAGTVTNAFASGTTLIPTGDGFTYFFYFNMHPHGTAPVSIWNYGQDPSFAGEITAGTETPSEGPGVFLYAPPDGFLACCTANITEPTIGANSDTQADNHFDILTWSGDDGATRKIATGESAVTGTVDFTPDWSWIKRRNGASNGSDHLLLDIVRGVDAFNGLSANATQAEGLTAAGSAWANFGDINNFETGGFTVQKGTDGSHTLEGINQSGGTYVGWNWKAGGSASSNTDGSITSTVSANTDAGFSIVTFPADNTAGRTVGHGLGVAPKMIITKGRAQTTAWYTYNYNIGAGNYLVLNSTAGSASSSGLWGNTHPTSTVFSIGNNDAGYNSGGANDALAYCFAEIEGYSKFGQYAGLGSGGEFVYLGFRPAWVMIKSTSASTQWLIFDSTRATSNLIDDVVLSTTIQVEGFSSGMELDFLSNGFKIRGSNNDISYSGKIHLYMAFAEAPFKYANAR